MKKRILSVLLVVILLFSVVPISASAASYPLIYLDSFESTMTIPMGEVGKLKFTVFPEYKNESYTVYVYDADGYKVASASDTYYNADGTFTRDITINVNTKELDLDVGKYQVEYFMQFYTWSSWHEAPNHYTATIEVIENKCNGKHTFKREQVITEPTCEKEGRERVKCSKCGHIVYNTLPKAHTFGSATVTKKPTPTASGKKTYTCTTCGETKTETIPTSSAVKITTQPGTGYAKSGTVAKTTVTATGDGLKYEWYIRDEGSTTYSKSSVKTNTYSYTMSAAKTNRRVYCIVTDKWGNSVKTNTVLMRMSATITQQPTNAGAFSGGTAKVSVKAIGDGLKYQWYIKDKGATAFKKSSITGTTYNCKMSASNDGRQVYCKVTDKYGKSVNSKTVTLDTRFKAKISTQPVTTYAKLGATAKVTLKASGDGLKYTWYVKNNGSSSYTKSSCTSATYSYKMSAATNNRRVYCKVTDKYGNSVFSETATVRMAATITKQPTSATVTAGKTVTASVSASGTGLKYAWYVKDKGATSFKKSSVAKSSYSCKITKTNSGRQVYCVVTDKYGKTVKSNTVTLKAK